MTPFDYPAVPHEQRHAPRGYADRLSYRPWLRDEFCFRCVYCLRREQWDLSTSLNVDHFSPTAQFPELELHYENLLYACARCNAAKSDEVVADPRQVLLSDRVVISRDGSLIALDALAESLISRLRLNSSVMIHFRRLWLEIIAMAKKVDAKLYGELMGFPEDLPNLQRLRPPLGNGRPNGISHSYFARRERKELPTEY